MSLKSTVDLAQRVIARSPFLVRVAVRIRNQCRCIIKYHLAESPDTLATGEGWIREVAARHGRYFVDVGANVGDWASALGALAHDDFRLVAYEPSRSACALLESRFEGDSRVEVRDVALGDRPGELSFLEEHDAGKGSSLVPGLTPIHGTNHVVTVTTLDAELDRLSWPVVDFVKIDAEGYDFRVMKGACNLLKSQRIALLQFEYNRSWQLAGDTLFGAMSFLASHGYTTYLLKRDGLFVLNYNLYEEYFEYSNFVAVSPKHNAIVERFVRGTI